MSDLLKIKDKERLRKSINMIDALIEARAEDFKIDNKYAYVRHMPFIGFIGDYERLLYYDENDKLVMSFDITNEDNPVSQIPYNCKYYRGGKLIKD